MAATTAFRVALNQGISSGNLVDTKIILFSRRDPSGRVCRPKALYANGHVLRGIPHFEGVLFGGFAESKSGDFKKAIDEDESAEGYGSDSDLEDDEDEMITSLKRANETKVPATTSNGDKVVDEDYEEHIEEGKVVKIPDVAFVTFQAFLLYLYTDVIDFAPFGSEEHRRSRSAELMIPRDDEIPRPSPKSIYRLADKYDVPRLKALALKRIRDQLSKCDIVEESFKEFVSQYDEVRDLYAGRLASIWMDDSTDSEATRASIKNKINTFVEGDLDHAAEVVSALWRIASNDPSFTAPADTPTPGRPTSPSHWSPVRTALIASIRKGTFFDRKYWARHSTSGDVLKPIYFSSTIMNDKAEKMNKLIKHLKGRNPFADDSEGRVYNESDCEDVGDEVPTTEEGEEEEKEEPTRAVLLTGSFSAWKSLFFYRCTDSILFAPLKSQGIDTRLDCIRRATVAAAPPPCSPKSIYVLADLLGIQPLCKTALGDIKSKVTLNNVVGEVFSPITVNQKEVMEMQCGLLISKFKEPGTIRLVTENIKHIPDGTPSHCAEALNLMLDKAFKAKKQRVGVMLRCTYHGCSLNGTPLSYSSVGSNTYHCQSSYIMQCVGCGRSRTGNHSSCQGCKKEFI